MDCPRYRALSPPNLATQFPNPNQGGIAYLRCVAPLQSFPSLLPIGTRPISNNLLLDGRVLTASDKAAIITLLPIALGNGPWPLTRRTLLAQDSTR